MPAHHDDPELVRVRAQRAAAAQRASIAAAGRGEYRDGRRWWMTWYPVTRAGLWTWWLAVIAFTSLAVANGEHPAAAIVGVLLIMPFLKFALWCLIGD